ncbi:MAG: DUF433 domain-containing protein [Chloroflexi bacterium]|nr:DUF433 domain-containing protein [Chloroflexota bacterium]
MSTITLSETTYHWLQLRAKDSAQTPDQVADELLRQQLAPKHAYVQVVKRVGGAQAMITGTRVPVSIVVGYLRMGETPETLVGDILPHLTLAQVYDALSFYHEHRGEIDAEIAENTEEYGQSLLRERLGEEGYLRVTGQSK